MLYNIVEIWGEDLRYDETLIITAIIDTDIEANCIVADIDFDSSTGRLPKMISIFVYKSNRVRIHGLKFKCRRQREKMRDQLLKHPKLRLKLVFK